MKENFFNAIKSKLILKKIFNNLKIIKLLQIIHYNKNLQNKLNIRKTNYKREYWKIKIEIIPKENEFGKFINIKNKYKSYFHIYFNDNELKEIKRNYIIKDDKVTKIRINIDYKIKSFSNLFRECRLIKSINFIKFNNTNINNMSCMFFHCKGLESLNFYNFKTTNVTDMQKLFFGCSSLESINLSKFNTNKVRDMSNMFSGCSSLKKLNISNFNTNNVNYLDSMFSYCLSLEELDLSNFNTDKIKSMSFMFFRCSSLRKLNISNFNINNLNTNSIKMILYGYTIKEIICPDDFRKKLGI